MEVLSVEIYEKLTKQISETKYLSTENSYRYRPIMRCFYQHYERLEYWLYKEDVFNELVVSPLFQDYTIEECERDLETLTEWMSLSKMQDTKSANTIEEFKNKKFRYQLTEYATEIERLTIALEEMEIKTASLEPKLFDRLRIELEKLRNAKDLTDEEANELWNQLNDDFTRLNENYQDFLKKFNEPKSEELMQNVLFLRFKSEIIKYLREFIKGYQRNVYSIKDSINGLNEPIISEFLDKINRYYKATPMLTKDFNFQKLRAVNQGKIESIFKWFIGTSSDISEGEKLLNTTNDIIVKITKYANALIELHGNMTNRREEYKYLCKMFDKITSIETAHCYASVIFGIENVRHYIGYSNLNTDSIINSYDIPPIEIALVPRTRTKKDKIAMAPIEDKTAQKQKLLEQYRREQEENRNILKGLIKDKKISLIGDISLSKVERKYIQKLLSSSKNKETEFGLTYYINKKDEKCKITSSDGIFFMNGVEIVFEGDLK